MTMRRPSLKDLQQLRQKLEGPPTLLCYICGREFGISSLQIHQKACLHKVKEINKRRPKSKQDHLPPPPTTAQPTRRSPPSLFESFNKESWELFCQHAPDEAERLLQDAQDRQARDEQSTTLEELWDERHAGSVVETPSMSPGPSAEATSVSATRSEESLALSREIHALRGMVELLAAQRERELAGVGGSGGVGSHHGHGRGISMEEQRARLRDRLQEIARAKLAIGAIYQRMDYPDAGAAVVLLDEEMAELNRVKEAVRLLEASELAQQSQQIDSLLQKVIDLEQKDTVEDAKEQQPYYAEPPMMPRSPPRQEFASPDAGTGIVLASLMQKISQLEAKEAENAAAVEKVLITSQMNAMMDKINRLQTERGGRSKSAESEHEAHMVLVQQLDQYKARYDESEREVRALRDSERALRDRLVLLDRAEQHVREVEERSRRSEEQARHTIEGLEGSVRRLQESEQQMMSSNANDTEATERQISHFKAQLASLHQVENENTRSRSTVESLRLKLGDAERRAEDSVKALAAMKYSAAEQISELKAQLAGANQRMEAHMQVSQSGDREALAQLRAAQNDMQGLRGELEEQKALVVETRKAAFTNESKLREDLLQSVLREKAHAHDDHLSADRQMSDIREQLTSAERRRTASAAETANLKAELERAANQIRKLKAKEDEHLQRLNVTQESSSTLQDELNVEKERSQHLFEEREIEQSKYRHKVHELTERVRKAELKGHEILEAFKKTKGAHEKVREALELQKQSELHKINEQLETLRIAYEDEKEEVVSLRERLGSSTAEGEDFQATVQILQQRNDELETENEKLKKRKGKGMSASKPHWGGTSAHNEEFSHLPSTASLQAGVRVQSATQKLRSNMDSTLPQIKSVLKKAMHSQHGLDVAGFIKRHDHEMKGYLSLDEFAAQMRHLCKVMDSTLKKLVKRIDVDKKGYIDAEDLQEFLEG